MSQYFCSIVDNALCNPAQRMYFDLGEYRYGLTVVGDGEPIVCFHGFSESSYTWDAINLPGYRVIRIDLIGHGDSDIPDEDKAYTIPSNDRGFAYRYFIIWLVIDITSWATPWGPA